MSAFSLGRDLAHQQSLMISTGCEEEERSLLSFISKLPFEKQWEIMRHVRPFGPLSARAIQRSHLMVRR